MPIISVDYLPQAAAFLFVFAIVYGLLTEAKVIKAKNANAVIALVFGIFAASYPPFTATLQGLIPVAAAVLAVVFVLVLIKKAIGDGDKKDKDMLPAVVALAVLLLLVGIFWDRLASYVPASIGAENLLWAFGIIVVVGIFYAAYRHEEKPKTGKHED